MAPLVVLQPYKITIPTATGKGYFGGGWSTALYNEIDGIDFITEAAINPSATLAQSRANLAGVNSSTRGYFAGGEQPGIVGWTSYSEIDGIQFDTEVAINPSVTLTVARHKLAGVNSSTRGYFGAGNTAYGYGNIVGEIDGIRFDTEASINPAASLVARTSLCGVNSSIKGYFSGGYNSTYYSEIDGIDFTTEAAINPSATLSIARQFLTGVNSSVKGYFGGGANGSGYSNEIDGIDFTTEAAINPSATLSIARYSPGGTNSSIKGYFGGGGTASSSSEIDGIDFTTEAAINPSATLSMARYGAAGVQSGAL